MRASSTPAARQARLNASFGFILPPEAPDALTVDVAAGRFAFLAPSLLLRITLGSRGVPVGEIAMFESRVCVRLRLFVMADLVKMGRLVVMVRGGVVVSGRLIVMLSRQLLLWHLRNSSRERAGVRVFRAAIPQGCRLPEIRFLLTAAAASEG